MNSSTELSTTAEISIEINTAAQHHPQRPVLEQFIHAVYANVYGADVKSYLPTLMGLHDQQRHYVAALGFRFARDNKLFLEHYLPQPIEAVMAEHMNLPAHKIDRAQIVEVGNLAGSHAGATRWLIVALAAYLQGAGFEWAVFTGVPSLRNSFAKLGLRLYPLGAARLDMLPPDEQAHWGRYYDARPVVTAINVQHTFGVLERCIRLETALAMLEQLWRASFFAGCNMSRGQQTA